MIRNSLFLFFSWYAFELTSLFEVTFVCRWPCGTIRKISTKFTGSLITWYISIQEIRRRTLQWRTWNILYSWCWWKYKTTVRKVIYFLIAFNNFTKILTKYRRGRHTQIINCLWSWHWQDFFTIDILYKNYW